MTTPSCDFGTSSQQKKATTPCLQFYQTSGHGMFFRSVYQSQLSWSKAKISAQDFPLTDPIKRWLRYGLPTCIYHTKSTVHVGKYTNRPMDPMAWCHLFGMLKWPEITGLSDLQLTDQKVTNNWITWSLWKFRALWLKSQLIYQPFSTFTYPQLPAFGTPYVYKASANLPMVGRVGFGGKLGISPTKRGVCFGKHVTTLV